ncbi:hypothetical protein [Domibacillus indicus]|uniref:hypothetical protein n=1 Tax=Domibacillus indicus TaxID=1437523 RepID=UPI000617DBC3|nr:hypothetical protein [Domibacillus indicus]
MKKGISVAAIIAGVLAFLIFAKLFIPNPFAEKLVKEKAEQYLEEYYNDNFKIYGVLDNSDFGVYMNFNYAAKVRDKHNGIEFLVYEDQNNGEMTDDYAMSKMTHDIEKEVFPYVKEEFQAVTKVTAMIEDKEFYNLDIEERNPNPKSFKEFEISPMLRIELSKKREEGDKKLLDNLISKLKENNILKHGDITLLYYGEEEQFGSDWNKTF